MIDLDFSSQVSDIAGYLSQRRDLISDGISVIPQEKITEVRLHDIFRSRGQEFLKDLNKVTEELRSNKAPTKEAVELDNVRARISEMSNLPVVYQGTAQNNQIVVNPDAFEDATSDKEAFAITTLNGKLHSATIKLKQAVAPLVERLGRWVSGKVAQIPEIPSLPEFAPA